MELSVRDVERLENTSFASAFASTADGIDAPGGIEDVASGEHPCTSQPPTELVSYCCNTVSICFTGTTSGVADATDALQTTGVVTLLPELELLDATRRSA